MKIMLRNVLRRTRSKTATAFSLVSQYYRSILECNIGMVTVIDADGLRAIGANCESTGRKIQNTNLNCNVAVYRPTNTYEIGVTPDVKFEFYNSLLFLRCVIVKKIFLEN